MWVLDTSAALRLFVPDGPVPPETVPALEAAARGGPWVLAPQLLLIEAGNVLLRKARRGELAAEEVDALLQGVASLPVRWLGHEAYVRSACQLAQIHHLSAYDALYLAIAHRHGARLLTADAALAAAAAARQ